MSLNIEPIKVFDYFNNMVDPSRARQLDFFSIARSICYLAVQIDGHSLHYHCHCFSCRICRILLTMLLFRNHRKLLQIVKKTNYLYITDDFIMLNAQILKKWISPTTKSLLIFLLKIWRSIPFFNLSKKFRTCQIVRRAAIVTLEILWVVSRVFCSIQIRAMMSNDYFLFFIA